MSAIEHTNPPAIASNPRRNPFLGGLALLQTALFLVPVVVLGRAIGWPASLRLPAAEALPLIAREWMAVQVGYWAYLLTSLALIPLAMALRSYARANHVRGPLVDTAAAVGAAAAILKMLGIVRWLVAMPSLAVLHGNADPATRAMIEIVYVTLNGYAGAVGELLGVQLVSGLWLVLTGYILTRIGHKWVGQAGLIIGVMFMATCLRTVFPTMAMLQTVAVPLALVWFVGLAAVTTRTRSTT